MTIRIVRALCNFAGGSSWQFAPLVLLGTALAVGCNLGPEQVSLSDPRVQAMLKAIDRIDRAALGFTPFPTNAQFRLEIASGRAYDAMLHVNGDTSRTIGFRKEGADYRWITEQEIHQGPGWYQTIDGTFREFVVVEYQTEKVDGIPLNQIWIRYTGSDTNLSGRALTLEDIKPVLSTWRHAAVKPQPPDLPEVGSDPIAFFVFLLMLVAFLAACCLAMFLGAVILALLALALAAGILSASVLAGILRRSVQTGFRTLFIQLGALTGLIAGGVGTATIIWLNKSAWNSPMKWGIGLAMGLGMGLIIAMVFNVVWSRIVRKLAFRAQKNEV